MIMVTIPRDEEEIPSNNCYIKDLAKFLTGDPS